MKVLLPVDGSRHSQEAVDAVARRQWPPGTVIRVLSVAHMLPPPAIEFAISGPTLEEIRQAQKAQAQRLTTSVAESLKKAGLETETVVREGEPRAEIIDEATERGADLIVIGSHGHTGVKRWLLGSVAQYVASHAPCSVEIVRRRNE